MNILIKIFHIFKIFFFFNWNYTNNLNRNSSNIENKKKIEINHNLFKIKIKKLNIQQTIKIIQQMKTILRIFLLMIIINIILIMTIPIFLNYIKKNFFYALSFLVKNNNYSKINLIKNLIVNITKNPNDKNYKELLLTKVLDILLKNLVSIQILINKFFYKTEINSIFKFILSFNILKALILIIVLIINFIMIIFFYYNNSLYNKYSIDILKNKIKIFLKLNHLNDEDNTTLKLLKYQNLLKKKYIKSVYYNSNNLSSIITIFIIINYIYYLNFGENNQYFIKYYNNYKYQDVYDENILDHTIIIFNFIIFFLILYINILKKNYIYLCNILKHKISWKNFCKKIL